MRLCRIAVQKRLSEAIKQARHIALLPFTTSR
jgi:ribosomal protein S18